MARRSGGESSGDGARCSRRARRIAATAGIVPVTNEGPEACSGVAATAGDVPSSARATGLGAAGGLQHPFGTAVATAVFDAQQAWGAAGAAGLQQAARPAERTGNTAANTVAIADIRRVLIQVTTP